MRNNSPKQNTLMWRGVRIRMRSEFLFSCKAIVFQEYGGIQLHMYCCFSYSPSISSHESDHHHQFCYHLFASSVTDFTIIIFHTYVSLLLNPIDRRLRLTDKITFLVSQTNMWWDLGIKLNLVRFQNPFSYTFCLSLTLLFCTVV